MYSKQKTYNLPALSHITLSLGLITLLMVFFAPARPVFAFGFAVNHAAVANGKQVMLSNYDSKISANQKKIYDNMVLQAGAALKIRETLGDNRAIYERDRLIGTLKDYDTIMRSLYFFQTRDKRVIDPLKNKFFGGFYMALSQPTPAAAATTTLQSLQNIMQNPVSPILQDMENENEILKDPLEAGINFKQTAYLHAYSSKAKQSIPAKVEDTMDTYRKVLTREIATRNYLLGVYARSYLAERATGNGIGRYMYGPEVIYDESANPWLVANNIVGGFFEIVKGGFTSPFSTFVNTASNILQGALNFITSIVNPKSDTNKEVQTSTPICQVDRENKDQSIRNQLRDCIWEQFKASKATDPKTEISISGTTKDALKIKATSVRQMLALNTIMWVRASLEVSTLILLSSAQLEMEALSAYIATGSYWMYPPSYYVWGNEVCDISSLSDEDKADGTGWSNTCLTEQERIWLTPTFTWQGATIDTEKGSATGVY